MSAQITTDPQLMYLHNPDLCQDQWKKCPTQIIPWRSWFSRTFPDIVTPLRVNIISHVWALTVKVALGRIHNIFATCSGAPPTTASCQLAALPQHSHNCCGYLQQVPSGRLATSCVATTCCQSWTCPNSRNMLRMLRECCESPQQGAQVYVAGDWQQICSLLWETCCQSIVSVDLRSP